MGDLRPPERLPLLEHPVDGLLGDLLIGKAQQLFEDEVLVLT